MNVWDDAASSNGGFDENVEFFVSSDGELQVSGSDA